MNGKDRKQLMLEYLSHESEQVISLAYMYAKNMYDYGVDVTKEINSAVVQQAALHNAYLKGRSDERILSMIHMDNNQKRIHRWRWVAIERLEFETVPAQWDGRDCRKMWNKINEIIDYINNEVEKRPKVLYGIENIHTGEITFNARGGAYQDKNAAYRKMAELGIKEHRLVEYKLESKGE